MHFCNYYAITTGPKALYIGIAYNKYQKMAKDKDSKPAYSARGIKYRLDLFEHAALANYLLRQRSVPIRGKTDQNDPQAALLSMREFYEIAGKRAGIEDILSVDQNLANGMNDAFNKYRESGNLVGAMANTIHNYTAMYQGAMAEFRLGDAMSYTGFDPKKLDKKSRPQYDATLGAHGGKTLEEISKELEAADKAKDESRVKDLARALNTVGLATELRFAALEAKLRQKNVYAQLSGEYAPEEKEHDGEGEEHH